MKWSLVAWLVGLMALISSCGNSNCTQTYPYTNAGCTPYASPYGTTAYPYGTTAYPYGTTAYPYGTTAYPYGH